MIAWLALSLAAAAAPPPLPVQPPAERARQMLAPQSPDPLWRTLAHTKVEADVAKGVFTAQHPAEVKALDGREVAVQGFMLVTSYQSAFNTFVLTRYTPVCAFCPPGAPNEAIEVTLNSFVKPSSGLVTVKGHLHLNKDGSSGLFFRLDDAELSE